ncbi:MAG: N(2)-fixation sustaining protein CowN [Psychromonas sp.]
MNNDSQSQSRYITFLGLDCDANADNLISMLDKNIQTEKGDIKWQAYFTKKRTEQVQLKHDNLNFIGHQTNTLYEYFASCEDEEAKSLLYKIEQQCC